MFDKDSNTYYHAKYNSGRPGLKVYFGEQMEVSQVTVIQRYDNVGYLKDLEGT